MPALIDYLGLIMTPTANPAPGDIPVRGASGGWTTAPVGDSPSGKVLTIDPVTNLPAWLAPPTGSIVPTGVPWAVNVRDGPNGALGTGVAEPATPFQQAYLAATTLGRDVFIPAGTYYINDGTQASVFALARDNARTGPKVRIVFDPGVKLILSALTPRLTDFNQQAPGDWFRKFELVGNGATIDANNIGGIQHVLMGTLRGVSGNQTNLNYEYLKASGFNVINVFTDSSDGTTNLRHTIWLSPLGSASSDTYGQFCEFSDININPDGTAPDGSTSAGAHGGGGTGGITVGNAGSTSKFHWDELWVRRCRWDRGLVSETFAAANGFYIGSRGAGGRGGMVDCYSRGASDTAFEINGPHQGVLERCLAVDPFNNGFLHRGANGAINPADPASKTVYINCETRKIVRAGTMAHIKLGVNTSGDFDYGVIEIVGGGVDYQQTPDATVSCLVAQSPANYRLVTVTDVDLYIKAGASAVNGTGSALVTSSVYFDLGNGGIFRIRGLTLHYEGSVAMGAGYTRRGFDMRGNWVSDWDGVKIDDQQTFTGVGTPGIRGATFGIATNGVDGVTKSESRGVVRNFKVSGSQGTAIEVGSFTVQQFLNADLLIIDRLDASEMQAGATALTTSGTNLQKVVATNTRQRGNPALPSVASSATLTLPAFNPPGDLIQVTGTTAVTSITASWVGRVVRLQVTGACTFTDNGTTLNLVGNFTGPGYLTLAFDGTNWVELGRSIP